MNKELLCTVAGTIIGSLIEEGVEEVFPGVGELGITGEIAGAVTGLISSSFSKREVKNAIETFVKYAYKRINTKTSIEHISDDELKVFAEKFKLIPGSQKRDIIANFKNVAPYEYQYILGFLKESKIGG
ncbi:MAG: hypothetical protein PF570_05315 [Candidatus Cloacimonetes bacterium]|jgi:hypothetical protein|nr:hypothetical protein [Candidatus Cloacimonadota bacterium]